MTTYREAGVDIDAGSEVVARIKKVVEKTFPFFPGKILSGIGGFSGIVEHPSGLVLALATDGVGSKLDLAVLLDTHTTVGIDLVAMCANDVAVTGITPMLFLDYFAAGKLIPSVAEQVVQSVALGCRQAEMALVGGETAELSGKYRPGDYELAGFAVGIAPNRGAIISGEHIKPGMNVYGVQSSGVHSNGYGLVRRAFDVDLGRPFWSRKTLEQYYERLGCTLGEELLKPTRIYVRLIQYLRSTYAIFGMAHITGGGLIDNPPRIMPEGLAMLIDLNSWNAPPIFRLIKERGEVSFFEMLRVFNCGMGLITVSPDEIREDDIVKIGEVVRSEDYKHKGSATLFKGGQHFFDG